MKPKDRYKEKALEYSKYFYPNLPDIARVINVPKVNTTNGLTNAIKKYIIYKGWFCERINTMGRQIDNRKVVTDVTGGKRQIGSVNWIPTTGQKGSADLSAHINKISVKIEVKNEKTKDKIRPEQVKYNELMELTGSVYYIARNFNDTIEWLDEMFEDNCLENKHKIWNLLRNEKNI